MPAPRTIWTIGHSTRTLEDFIALLHHYQVETVIDVRRFPGSRRLPQFGEAALSKSLAEQGIGYQWISELGGRRRPVPDSVNDAWRNVSFRGYADHLESDEFARGLELLLKVASQKRAALMCAEVLWWRCHRALVSDVLQLSGIEVLHIQDQRHVTRHPFTSPARLVAGHLSYREGVGEPLHDTAKRKRSATS